MNLSFKFNLQRLLIYSVYLFSGIVFVAVYWFSLFYIFHSQGYLKNWFLSLNPCIYNTASWQNWFNASAKEKGNLYCIAAIIASVMGLMYISWKWATLNKTPREYLLEVVITSWDMLFAGLLILLQIFLWLWGQTLVAPAYDEVFSAVNCASVPVFQCLSYYMLPNNHIFFNVLNDILFHNAGDHVFTGRLISLFAYFILGIWAYFWFAGQFKSRFSAFLAASVLAVQFPIWGFAFQARGYELYALAQWAAFVLLFGYINTGRKKYLLFNSVFCIIGYITIPSFLYFHAAQILFMGLYQVVQKRFDFRFWKYQVLIFLFVFFFYLPALCFSGTDALLHNKYVSPSTTPALEFFHKAMYLFRTYIEYCFSNSSLTYSALSLVLFLLPVLLLLSKKTRWTGIFFILLVAVFAAMVFLMKTYPFHRSLVGQYAIILTIVIVALYHLIDRIIPKYLKALFPGIMVLLAVYFLWIGPKGMAFNLYFDDARPSQTVISQTLDSLPKGTVLGCSNESFYWYYLCRQNHIAVHKCPDGSEDYFVKEKSELFPKRIDSSIYILQSKTLDYEMYRRGIK